MVPSTGLRFECTLNTFMNTLIFSASRSRNGSRALPTTTTLPSAGEITMLACVGTTRGGSRKNWTMNSRQIHASAAGTHHCAYDNAIATTAAITTNGHPSRAISGCGYVLLTEDYLVCASMR